MNKKGDYLLPVNVVMPGEWEVVLNFLKDKKPIYTGSVRFNVVGSLFQPYLVLLSGVSPAFGKSYLLYLEAQGVGGYDTAEDGPIYYSMNPLDVMQKPSVGFDYLQRFSSETGDWGSFALQMRLAYNEAYRATGEDEFQAQIYNAFFKYKAGFADLWIGHSRIAFGLAILPGQSCPPAAAFGHVRLRL